MYALIKLSVEEAIKNSEVLIWTYKDFDKAKEAWEEEAALMQEDEEKFPGNFDKSADLFEATFEYDDFITKVQLVDLKENELVAISF